MSEAQKKKLIKVATVPTSLNTFCYGQLKNAFRTLRSRCCFIANERT